MGEAISPQPSAGSDKDDSGRLPEVIIIARHAARLDTADREWHLTSPTPYDTPLTYGGWLQSRALGARIASLLDARDLANPLHVQASSIDDLRQSHVGDRPKSSQGRDEGKGTHPPGHVSWRRRKRQVIIHSSPFLRCVQTSVAISAGMAQYLGNTPKPAPNQSARAPQLHSGSPMLNAVGPGEQHLSSIPEPVSENSKDAPAKEVSDVHTAKPLLRIDAFLGEWLNPDYFDDITPPPSSVMMVAGAKADLLRPGDYITAASGAGNRTAGGFPGGWRSSTAESNGDGPLSSMSSLQKSLPRRTYSHGGASMSGPRSATTTSASRPLVQAPKDGEGYIPLTPDYAISQSDPIPAGYVAHARDACVEVDYQWDSMREPQNWGSGGEYGEEWGAMHKRFRQATQSMISWYKDNDRPAAPLKELEPSDEAEADEAETDDHEEPAETILIIVSHGAGCNAIIGGLTDQTVLLDVGMASLTMAVRKDAGAARGEQDSGDAVSRASGPRRRTPASMAVSEEYEVKLMASTEHLRAGSNPFAIPQLPLLTAKTSPPILPHRLHRSGQSGSSIEESFSIGEPSGRTSTSAAIGSVRRVSRSSSPMVGRGVTTSPVGNTMNGLWNRTPSGQAADEAEPGDDMVLNFGDAEPSSAAMEKSSGPGLETGRSDGSNGSSRPTSSDANIALNTARSNLKVQRTNSQRGLWNSSSAVIDEKKEREVPPKRRWTVNERGR